MKEEVMSLINHGDAEDILTAEDVIVHDHYPIQNVCICGDVRHRLPIGICKWSDLHSSRNPCGCRKRRPQFLEEDQKVGAVVRAELIVAVAGQTWVLPVNVDAVQVVFGIERGNIGDKSLTARLIGDSGREIPASGISISLREWPRDCINSHAPIPSADTELDLLAFRMACCNKPIKDTG